MDALSHFPPSSTTLNTEKGKAFCIKIDVFKKKMWFAYAENPMAWFDMDVLDIKRYIAINKKGEKCPPLEDAKPQEIASKPVDLIQENNVDRFEKKRNPRNKKPQQRQGKPENRTAPQNSNEKPIKKMDSSETSKPTKRKPFKKKPNNNKDSNE
jgi:hypothetical protein